MQIAEALAVAGSTTAILSTALLSASHYLDTAEPLRNQLRAASHQKLLLTPLPVDLPHLVVLMRLKPNLAKLSSRPALVLASQLYRRVTSKMF